MNTYNGIPISEHRLPAYSIIFTVLFVGLALAFSFWLYTVLTVKSPKARQHLRKLKAKAENDDFAKLQLEKIKRKNKRRISRNKENIATNVALLCLVVFLAGLILALGVIPGWVDYAEKDYISYTGEIKVYNQMKRSRIIPDDGTCIWGRGDFDAEDTYGTVIYSRRTRQFLGGIN